MHERNIELERRRVEFNTKNKSNNKKSLILDKNLLMFSGFLSYTFVTLSSSSGSVAALASGYPLMSSFWVISWISSAVMLAVHSSPAEVLLMRVDARMVCASKSKFPQLSSSEKSEQNAVPWQTAEFSMHSGTLTHGEKPSAHSTKSNAYINRAKCTYTCM